MSSRCLKPAAQARPAIRRLVAPGTGGRSQHSHRVHSLKDVDIRQELSTTYDADKLVEFFSKRPALVTARMLEVSTKLLAFVSKQALRKPLGIAATPEQDEADAKELCDLLSALGPTFVKLGQTLSTREDIIGKKYARALANLQVAAPPFDDRLAITVIQRELKRDPQTLFRHFNEEHIASASLGQVYRARSWADGAKLAVKVQRPDMLGTIALDVYVLRQLLQLVRRLTKVRSDLRYIADEVGRGLFAELDYLTEARQAALFAEAHSHLAFIKAVEVVPELSTSRVLTTRWVDGDCPTDLLEAAETSADAAEREAYRARLVDMVNMGVECSLSQLLETGIMHADPHPGNLILMRDGRLAYLDFGLLTLVPASSSMAMMACLVHVALGEWRKMADDLGNMGFLKERTDRDELAASLADEIVKVWPLAGSFSSSSFLADGSAREGGELAERISQGSVRPELGLAQGLSFGKLAKAIIKLAIKYRFNLPAYYTLLVRSLCSLEGLALRVDPSFSIVNAGIPILLRRLLTDTRPPAVNLLRELLLEDGKLRLGMLEGLLRNYSAEAGKAMKRSPGSNVVLKGVQPSSGTSGTPYAVANAPRRAETAMAASMSTWRPPPGAAVADVATASAVITPERTSSSIPGLAPPGSTVAAGEAPASDTDDDSRVAGLAVMEEAVAHEDATIGAAPPAAAAMAPAPGSSGAAAAAGAAADEDASLVASVVTMVLSAKAAGVRRVFLEADMVDIVDQVASPEGAALRSKAADAISLVVSWRLIGATVMFAFSQAWAALSSKLAGMLGLQRAAQSRPLGAAVTFGAITLSPVAFKRAQLVALLSFKRLWQQSWLKALSSMVLGVRLLADALSIRGRRRAAVSAQA